MAERVLDKLERSDSGTVMANALLDDTARVNEEVEPSKFRSVPAQNRCKYS